MGWAGLDLHRGSENAKLRSARSLSLWVLGHCWMAEELAWLYVVSVLSLLVGIKCQVAWLRFVTCERMAPQDLAVVSRVHTLVMILATLTQSRRNTFQSWFDCAYLGSAILLGGSVSPSGCHGHFLVFLRLMLLFATF